MRAEREIAFATASDCREKRRRRTSAAAADFVLYVYYNIIIVMEIRSGVTARGGGLPESYVDPPRVYTNFDPRDPLPTTILVNITFSRVCVSTSDYASSGKIKKK